MAGTKRGLVSSKEGVALVGPYVYCSYWRYIPISSYIIVISADWYTGRAYSVSLRYRHACHSVMIAHKLQYIQHHHYLLVPPGPYQNYEEVERNFPELQKQQKILCRTLAKQSRSPTTTSKHSASDTKPRCGGVLLEEALVWMGEGLEGRYRRWRAGV